MSGSEIYSLLILTSSTHDYINILNHNNPDTEMLIQPGIHFETIKVEDTNGYHNCIVFIEYHLSTKTPSTRRVYNYYKTRSMDAVIISFNYPDEYNVARVEGQIEQIREMYGSIPITVLLVTEVDIDHRMQLEQDILQTKDICEGNDCGFEMIERSNYNTIRKIIIDFVRKIISNMP